MRSAKEPVEEGGVGPCYKISLSLGFPCTASHRGIIPAALYGLNTVSASAQEHHSSLTPWNSKKRDFLREHATL